VHAWGVKGSCISALHGAITRRPLERAGSSPKRASPERACARGWRHNVGSRVAMSHGAWGCQTGEGRLSPYPAESFQQASKKASKHRSGRGARARPVLGQPAGQTAPQCNPKNCSAPFVSCRRAAKLASKGCAAGRRARPGTQWASDRAGVQSSGRVRVRVRVHLHKGMLWAPREGSVRTQRAVGGSLMGRDRYVPPPPPAWAVAEAGPVTGQGPACAGLGLWGESVRAGRAAGAARAHPASDKQTSMGRVLGQEESVSVAGSTCSTVVHTRRGARAAGGPTGRLPCARSRTPGAAACARPLTGSRLARRACQRGAY
jgi:hypothetical protein